jgi:hypothetical protein
MKMIPLWGESYNDVVWSLGKGIVLEFGTVNVKNAILHRIEADLGISV